MSKNVKSIDGLSTRRSKTAAISSTSTKTTKNLKNQSSKKSRTTQKSRATQKPKTTQKSRTTQKPKTVQKSRTAQKTAKKPVAAQTTTLKQSTATPTSPPSSSIEDFLKPVQAFDFDEQSGKLQATKKPILKSSKMPKEKSPTSKKRKIIKRVSIIAGIILVLLIIGFIIWGNDIIAKITGGQGNVFDILFTDETYKPLKTDENGRTNILAFGTSGYNMEGEEGGGTHDGAQLTDSIMVISLNQETGDFAMLSLPRDLKASPTCTATGKINEVYWCNNMNGDDEQAGANALMQEVGDILGLDFQYYAHLNWSSLIQIVNTLGGINITLDENIEDYYFTGAVFEAGKEYTINGDQALGLARARHGTASGDFSRGASQQKILIGIKDKVFEKSLSITDLISLASTLGDNLRTNFSIDEFRTLAHLTADFDFDKMRQVSLIEPEKLMTTGTLNGISYVLPVGGAGNYSSIKAYVAKMFSNDPRSYENASILVLNASETPGVATTEQSTLEEDGYSNIAIDDAPAGEYSEGITLYAITDSAPGTKKLLEEKYQTTAKTAEELPAGISNEYDFVLIINNQNN